MLAGTKSDWLFSRKRKVWVAVWGSWKHNPRRVMELHEMKSGWAIRLLESGHEVQRSFPYPSAVQAAIWAEGLAERRWG